MTGSRARNLFDGLLSWASNLIFLMGTSFGERYRRSKLSILLAIGEPLGVIAIFAGTHSLITSRAPFGPSVVLFFATGILPFYLFFHISWRMRAWDHLRRLPRVTEVDLFLIHVLDELLTKVVIIIILGFAIWLTGIEQAIPQDPLRCLLALLIIAVQGAAVGLLNAVIAGFFFSWLYIYAILIRGWMAFSGVLFVVDYMPPALREIAIWNPITHAITYYRFGYYADYPHRTLEMEYLLWSTAGLFFFAIVAIVSTRPYRSTV
ncbi:ABC transporter permease [Reyranella aquatilis]|uniref:ABC transporter permease n=1 Tax=Reyranella aquatilis TaxID=2035356 RepID=A0ABS8L035_9HYPH|nr:ABC transporter permease [Reyranella aquatilis]MCC8431691.1 ABC transporter permease [Reyranella aquatilis]